MITKERFNRGSGGIWRLTAPEGNELELEAEVLATLESIDRWASPCVDSRRKQGDKLIVEIKYYGMD